jgi:hypothetical protein
MACIDGVMGNATYDWLHRNGGEKNTTINHDGDLIGKMSSSKVPPSGPHAAVPIDNGR